VRRIPRPVAIRYRLRERALGPGGRTPRQAADAIRQFAVEDVSRFSSAHQLGFEDTMLRLIDGTTSLARFGDGELLSMLRPGYDLYFQRTTPELSAELRSIWTMQDLDAGSLLLGFPDVSKGPYWSDVWANAWPDLRLISRTDITYGNTHVTRPRFFSRLGQRGVDLWRQVWADKSVCVVTGTASRFVPIAGLFDSAATVSREDAPAIDAYAHVDALERRLLDNPADVLLLSLGPSATVLAARLSRRGRRAIDIGHITSSYRTVFLGDARPEHQPMQPGAGDGRFDLLRRPAPSEGRRPAG
jgi:hypothetical protein